MKIAGCGNLTSVAGLLRHRLSALRTLEISSCEALVDLHAEEGFQHLHSIVSLRIEYCPKLKMATDAVALTSLSELRLSGWNHITSFPSEEACRRLTSLKELQLEDWGGLMSVEGLKALSHLERLRIKKCPKLVQAAAASIKGKEEEEEFTLTVDILWIDDPLLLHIEPLRKHTSVKVLWIEDCRNLESEGDINSWLLRNRTSLRAIHLEKYTAKSLPRSLQDLSSLESLEITGAHQLQSLPRSLQALSSLERLQITGAYQLQSLQRMPSSLRSLRISGCNETLKERCAEDEGADWPNIKHIPKIVVSESDRY